MLPPEVWLAGAILVSLTIYALTGGADFGGGVWDLFARGPRSADQRELIAHAIAPIWEANHVWLILIVVVLFTAFPLAFAAIGTALHIPLMLALIGIVLRGSAFTFRAYERRSDRVRLHWSRIFAITSTVSPVLLGVCAGAIAAGGVPVERASGRITTDFFSHWLAPIPAAIGLFTLALFAFLAAVYLTMETRDAELRELFRRRALVAALAAGILAWSSFGLAAKGAPRIHDGLVRQWWSMPLLLLASASAIGAMSALWTRRFALARPLAMVVVSLVLLGWGGAQYPYLLEPDLTIHNAAAPPRVLRLLLVALAGGAVILVPSLILLFRVFKGHALSVREGPES